MISISLVLYNTSNDDIIRILDTINLNKLIDRFYLIDNSPKKLVPCEILKNYNYVEYIFNNKNLGYGTGHNIAIKKSLLKKNKYHLVINPDIYFESKMVFGLIDFMNKNSQIGQVMPKILNENESIQRVAKLLPRPLDLFQRAFLPSFLMKKNQRIFTLSKYRYDRVLEAPYLSGCFMFLRLEALKKVGIFDERFFMYPEDIDLSRRIHMKYKTVVNPFFSVIHRHEKASYKSLKMKIIHVYNVIKYFNKWGWFYDKQRTKINKRILQQFK